VAQVFASVFASFYSAFEAILGDSNPDIGWLLSCGAGQISDMDFNALNIALISSGPSDGELRFGAVGCFLNGGLSIAGVVADELGLAVDHHLRGEGRFAFEAVDVSLLAESPIGRGIGVYPPVVIPVIDVFFQSDDLGAFYGLKGFEFAEERVGWRTGGAALRSEEFDQDGSAVGLDSGGLRGLSQ
jgi:hypothetical protein